MISRKNDDKTIKFSLLASPALGRVIQLLSYSAKAARWIDPSQSAYLLAELSSDFLLKEHTAALQKELKRQGEIKALDATRDMLVHQLAELEGRLTARQQVTEERLSALLQAALQWESAGGRVELKRGEKERLKRADQAFDDLLLAAQMRQSASVASCEIRFRDGEPLRYLKWVFFPPRTILLGASFVGTLKFKDCLPEGAWTNALITVAHSLEWDDEASLQLNLASGFVWADDTLQPSPRLALSAVLSESRKAREVADFREEPLEIMSEALLGTLTFGELSKTLSIPTAGLTGHAVSVHLTQRALETPLLIYHLKPLENHENA